MLRKLFDILANMGVWIRLNDPRHEPISEAGRAWGEVTNDFVLSLQALNPDTLSVLIKNVGTADKAALIPGWLGFYRVLLVAADGTSASLKAFGREVLSDLQNTSVVERTFPVDKSLSAEIPIAVLFDLRPGRYNVVVSSVVPGEESVIIITSNRVTISR